MLLIEKGGNLYNNGKGFIEENESGQIYNEQ
jgi:hypothetical protein